TPWATAGWASCSTRARPAAAMTAGSLLIRRMALSRGKWSATWSSLSVASGRGSGRGVGGGRQVPRAARSAGRSWSMGSGGASRWARGGGERGDERRGRAAQGRWGLDSGGAPAAELLLGDLRGHAAVGPHEGAALVVGGGRVDAERIEAAGGGEPAGLVEDLL